MSPLYIAIHPSLPILCSPYWSHNYETMQEEAGVNCGVVTNTSWFFKHFGYDPTSELTIHPSGKGVGEKTEGSYRQSLYRNGLSLSQRKAAS